MSDRPSKEWTNRFSQVRNDWLLACARLGLSGTEWSVLRTSSAARRATGTRAAAVRTPLGAHQQPRDRRAHRRRPRQRAARARQPGRAAVPPPRAAGERQAPGGDRARAAADGGEPDDDAERGGPAARTCGRAWQASPPSSGAAPRRSADWPRLPRRSRVDRAHAYASPVTRLSVAVSRGTRQGSIAVSPATRLRPRLRLLLIKRRRRLTAPALSDRPGSRPSEVTV